MTNYLYNWKWIFSYKIYIRNLAIFLFMFLVSCKKLVEIPAPIDSISNENVFTIDETAIAAVTGIYAEMSKSTSSTIGGFSGASSIGVLTGLSADELVFFDPLNTGRNNAYYTNALSAEGQVFNFGFEHWSPLYNYVYQCNTALEGLIEEKAVAALTPSVRQQLLGEVKFMRAFFYFHLVNLYGDVPLALSTDYNINTLLFRSSVNEVLKQIKSDLIEATSLISENYLASNLLSNSADRVRPTKWAALALLARVHLYLKEYQQAESVSTQLIENVTLFGLPSLNNAFLKTSKEAIWQLQPTTTYYNTEDSRFFVITANGPNGTNFAYLSDQLLNAFEQGDKRAVMGNWIDSTIYTVSGSIRDTVYYPYKYKKSSLDSAISGNTASSAMIEYQIVLRLAEQYLIRAEARAMLSNIDGSRQDLLAIRNRAGLSSATLTANDQSSLLSAIAHERQVELFTEWGHRWFDLKRTNKVDEVMTVVTPIKSKGATLWQSYQKLYPISPTDIQRAPNLFQNPGY